jgi:hypothetical protein
MSTRPSDDSRAPLHDPAFDAAWRAVSSEVPPPAADAAILAAARRAVHTGPRRVAEATRPERWWAPLAAAATIGAIAIGILQLAAPDKTAAPPAILTDMPVAPAQAPKVDALAAPDRQRTARPDAEVEASAPAKDVRKQMALEPRAAMSANAIPAPAQQSAARQASAPPASASPAATTGAVPTTPHAPVSESPAAADSAPAGIGAVTPSPVAQPFPAGTAERREMAAVEARPPPQPLAKLAAGAAADASPAARAQLRAPLPVAEWLALIRELRADGRSDEAAKELAAFRLAHPDEARRLPDDLRDWRPPDP